MDDRTAWLETFIQTSGGVAGTVHRLEGDHLHLVAAHNIPEKVLGVIQVIPKGKGMAGLAWERDRPVQTCNLKEDETGDVRPGAKAVEAQAAVAIPVRAADGQLQAVVGVAYADNRELSEATIAELSKAASAYLSLEE